MASFIKALLFVVVAEMGDKTQLLAMALVSKYKVRDVLWGVFIATVLNHALAVAVGSYLSSLIPLSYIKIAAALSFVVFGLWTLRGDKADDDGNKKSKFGPIMTVVIAFFIAEMGDKTQLMTIAIAAQYRQPWFVLMGSTTGMMIADGIGILFGAWMCRHVPEKYIKWGAGVIFIFFGTFTLYENYYISHPSVIYAEVYFLILAGLVYLAGFKFAYKNSACNVVLKNTSENPETK